MSMEGLDESVVEPLKKASDVDEDVKFKTGLVTPRSASKYSNRVGHLIRLGHCLQITTVAIRSTWPDQNRRPTR